MLTAGQIKYAAFKAELSKLSGIVDWVAERPLTSAALGAAGSGTYKLFRHGPWGESGRSIPETRDIQKSQMLEGAELKKALKDQKSHALAAEAAGAGIGAAGVAGAGLLANQHILGPSIVKAEKGLTTSQEELGNMFTRAGSDLTARGAPIPRAFVAPDGGLDVGVHIPKGGYQPSFLRNWEARQNAVPVAKALQITPEDAKKLVLDAMKGTGAVVLPGGVGPHVAAHELGHSLFGATRLGKASKALRLPGYLGTAAGTAMASSADPDSTTSKVAPLVAAAGIAPAMGEELGASLKGLKLMKNTGFTPAQLSTARKQMGKAFGTYAAGIGLPVIAAPYIIRKVREYNRKRREEKGIESPGVLQSRIDALGE